MDTYIEEIFRRKAEMTDHCILVAQWEYDKRLLPDALKAINQVFPHYSLHDESHSISILNNIVNVLGKDTIVQLNCMDLWLILETAYWHDLGMVVTADMILEALEDDFPNYFRYLLANPSAGSVKYSSFFKLHDNKLMFKDAAFSVEAYNAVRFLFSDYFRGHHAANSQAASNHPRERLSLASPRILIPIRLYGIQSEICACHTKHFEDAFILPQVENGLSTQYAHPRFVACLLRIGDVLDIDNNRFSDVLQRTIQVLPDNSRIHLEKHRSITHLRIDSKQIEIVAKCPNPQVAKITNDWFRWIEEEFAKQTSAWNKIVPEDLMYALPNVNETRVTMDEYYSVNSEDSPQFTIDTSKALELLKGQNLYSDKFASIRELLQNAVDSTLIRFYLDNQDNPHLLEGVNQDFLNILKFYQIEVEIKENDSGFLSVSISDKGIGLKRNHLQFLSNTGSSEKNVERSEIIARMPEWLRPSGAFGIGFQSVYLITDCVRIETKAYFTDECYGLEMYDPNSAMHGDIYIKKIRRLSHPGLKISFEIPLDEPSPENKDPFARLPFSTKDQTIFQKIKEFAEMSFVPISINGEVVKRKEMQYYDKETGIELAILPKIEIKDLANLSFDLYYKNVKLPNQSLGELLYLNLRVNLHKGSAKDMLSVSRDKLKPECQPYLHNQLISTIKKYFLSDTYSKPEGNELPCQQFFALYYELGQAVLDRLGYKGETEPLLYVINTSTEPKFTLEAIKKFQRVVIKTVSKELIIQCDKCSDKEVILEGNLNRLDTVFHQIFPLLLKLASERFRNCYVKRSLPGHMPELAKQLGGANLFDGHEFIFTNNENEELETEYCIDNIKSLFPFGPLRCYFYYMKGYEALLIPACVQDGVEIPFHLGCPIPNHRVARILSPFIQQEEGVYDARTESFYKYVHQLNKKPMDEIKASYDRFVKECREKGIVPETLAELPLQ